MAEIRKAYVTETPNCWLCANGTIESKARNCVEFLDTASVHCRHGFQPGCLNCMKAYQLKNTKN